MDGQIRVSRTAIEQATTGDVAMLRTQLAEAEIDAIAAEQLLQVVAEPRVSFVLLTAVGEAASVRRGLVGSNIALLHGLGDDQESTQPLLVAGSGCELVHQVLAGLGFGARRARVASASVELSEADDGFRIALGERPLPDPIVAPSDRPIRWWSLILEDEGHSTTVLDAQDLWLQRGTQLEPIGTIGVWQHLSTLLAAVSELERGSLPGESGSP